MTRDVHHVVDPPEEPEIAVGVDPCAVTREVDVPYFDQYVST